jgi:hypothetical protein
MIAVVNDQVEITRSGGRNNQGSESGIEESKAQEGERGSRRSIPEYNPVYVV